MTAKVSERTILKLKHSADDLHPGHKREQLIIKALYAQTQTQSLITEDLRCTCFLPTVIWSRSKELNPELLLWDGCNTAFLGSKMLSSEVFSNILHLYSEFWWLWAHAWCMCANVRDCIRRRVFAYVCVLSPVFYRVWVAHIWSESVHVSGCWLGREVAGAIENLCCFHRDDGNLRDFPYGSEIIHHSRSFKYPRLFLPPC